MKKDLFNKGLPRLLISLTAAIFVFQQPTLQLNHSKPVTLPNTITPKKLLLTTHHPSSIINKRICPKGIALSLDQNDEIVKHLMDRCADDFTRLSYHPEDEFIGWHVREVSQSDYREL